MPVDACDGSHESAASLGGSDAAAETDSAQHANGLADLPAAWLQLLPAALEPQSRLSLFTTCKLMRDLMLAQSFIRLRFQLPLPAARASAAKDSLARSCNQSSSPSIRLVLAGDHHDAQGDTITTQGGNHDAAQEASSSATNLMLGAMEAAGHKLTAINTVELQNMVLDALVPSGLALNCPNLTRLQLDSCRYTTPSDPTTTTTTSTTTTLSGPSTSTTTTRTATTTPSDPTTTTLSGPTTTTTTTTTSSGPSTTTPTPPPDPNITTTTTTTTTTTLSGPSTTTATTGTPSGPSTTTTTTTTTTIPPTDTSTSTTTPPPYPTATATLPATFAQLKHLLLLNPPDSPIQYARWQHQAQHALPGLTSLGIDIGGSMGQVVLTKWLQCFAALGAQLTHLCLSYQQHSHQAAFAPQFAHWFPNLSEVCLGWRVSDADLEVLLGGGLHRLRHVQCKGFQLRRSYTHRPCCWTHLTFQELDLASFARLPLAGVRSLQLAPQDQRFIICLSDDKDVTMQAVGAVGRVGVLDWKGVDEVSLICFDGGGSDCAAVMPLLGTPPHPNPPHPNPPLSNPSQPHPPHPDLPYPNPPHANPTHPTPNPSPTPCRVSSMEFCVALVDRECLSAMALVLSSIHTLKRIKLKACTFPSPVWPLLLPSLPPSVELVHFHQCHMTVGNLIRMCVAACRPVTVCVHGIHSRWEAGWEQRVRDAMAHAGHHFVEVVF